MKRILLTLIAILMVSPALAGTPQIKVGWTKAKFNLECFCNARHVGYLYVGDVKIDSEHRPDTKVSTGIRTSVSNRAIQDIVDVMWDLKKNSPHKNKAFNIEFLSDSSKYPEIYFKGDYEKFYGEQLVKSRDIQTFKKNVDNTLGSIAGWNKFFEDVWDQMDKPIEPKPEGYIETEVQNKHGGNVGLKLKPRKAN